MYLLVIGDYSSGRLETAPFLYDLTTSSLRTTRLCAILRQVSIIYIKLGQTY